MYRPSEFAQDSAFPIATVITRLSTVCNVQSKEETLKSMYTDTPAFVEIHVVPSVLVQKDAGEKVDVLHYTHGDGRHVPEGKTTGTIGRRECVYSSDCI